MNKVKVKTNNTGTVSTSVEVKNSSFSLGLFFLCFFLPFFAPIIAIIRAKYVLLLVMVILYLLCIPLYFIPILGWGLIFIIDIVIAAQVAKGTSTTSVNVGTGGVSQAPQQELSTEEKANLYDEIQTTKIKRTGNSKVDMKETIAPWKKVFGIIFLGFQPLVIFSFISMVHNPMYEVPNILYIPLIIFLIIAIIQLTLYLVTKFNIIKHLGNNTILKHFEKQDLQVLFLLVTGGIILLFNITAILIAIFGIGGIVGNIFYGNLIIFYQYVFALFTFQEVGGTKGIIQTLEKYKTHKIASIILDFFKKNEGQKATQEHPKNN